MLLKTNYLKIEEKGNSFKRSKSKIMNMYAFHTVVPIWSPDFGRTNVLQLVEQGWGTKFWVKQTHCENHLSTTQLSFHTDLVQLIFDKHFSVLHLKTLVVKLAEELLCCCRHS